VHLKNVVKDTHHWEPTTGEKYFVSFFFKY